MFVALAELRRGNDAFARERVREARERFAALSLPAVNALFDETYIGERLHREFEQLPDIGLPRD